MSRARSASGARRIPRRASGSILAAPLVDPVPPAAAQPENYLAGKYRTPSGR